MIGSESWYQVHVYQYIIFIQKIISKIMHIIHIKNLVDGFKRGSDARLVGTFYI